MRRIAGRIGLLVGDDLRGLRAVVPADFARAHDPQIALVDGIARAGLDGAAVASISALLYCGVPTATAPSAVAAGIRRHVHRRSLVVVSVLPFCVVMEDQLHMDVRADRLVVVVHGRDAELRLLARMHGIAHRLHMHAEGAVGRQEACLAR